MSVSLYRRNVTDTKYTKRRDQIDVLVPTDDYDEDLFNYGTRSYERDDELYSQENMILFADKMAIDKKGRAAWNLFEKYLNESTPLKIMHWTSLRDEGDTSATFLNQRGDLANSFDSLVESIPVEALDAVITIQAKPIQDEPCKQCIDGYDSDGNEDGDLTEEEKMRHNLHIVDSKLTIAPLAAGDEQNLFLGQEDQVTTKKKLRDILIDRMYDTDSLKVCVAQENVYSKDESNTVASISNTGRIVIEGGDKCKNSAPLASLLPWIRVPSFLLPTDDTHVEIQDINFWMCPDECRTNTHYDGHHNILMVLHGTKTVELSPPGTFRGSPVHSQHANHPFLLRCTDVGGHLINENFLYDTGPLANASVHNNIVVSVSAEEAIFIPEGWWHRVESSADCVAINIWFDHTGSSIARVAHENNPHMLPYQAREMLRRYVDANIEDVNQQRLGLALTKLLGRLGFGSIGDSGWHFGWKCDPGQGIRQFVDTMGLYRLIPEVRTDDEIEKGMMMIERFVFQLLGVSDRQESADLRFPALRHLVLPYAALSLGMMISLFIVVLDPEKKRDRIAMMSLFEKFPAVATRRQREVFTMLVNSIAQEACYKLSITWEKHESAAEAEASYNSLFGRCVGDEGRKYFLKEIDEFRDESARRLIFGDLMLLNPRPGE